MTNGTARWSHTSRPFEIQVDKSINLRGLEQYTLHRYIHLKRTKIAYTYDQVFTLCLIKLMKPVKNLCPSKQYKIKTLNVNINYKFYDEFKLN